MASSRISWALSWPIALSYTSLSLMYGRYGLNCVAKFSSIICECLRTWLAACVVLHRSVRLHRSECTLVAKNKITSFLVIVMTIRASISLHDMRINKAVSA